MSLAACGATLDTYTNPTAAVGVIEHMWRIGRRFIEAGVATGYPCHPVLVDGAKAAERAAARGHLFHPLGFNVSYSHTVEDADAAIEALR